MNYEENLLFTPEGVRDTYGIDCENRNIVEHNARVLMNNYGFEDIQTPTFEFFDIFNRERGTVGSKDMFKFFDRYNNTLVLRPDITPSIARCVAKYYSKEEMPIRLSYGGSTFKQIHGYHGKLAEVYQLGAELINDGSSDADAEMIALTVEILKNAGLDEFTVDVGHAGFIKGIMNEAGFDVAEVKEYKDMLSNKNIFAVERFVSDKDISASLKELLIKLPDLFGGIETIDYALERVNDKEAIDALERLKTVYQILTIYGVEGNVTFDLSTLSNYDYYTGIVFKAYTYGAGEAIVSGGRYDNLIEQFGKKANAVGLALLLDQLMKAIDNQNKNKAIEKDGILILFRSNNRQKAISISNEYRNQGKKVVLMRKAADFDNEDYKKYAEKRNLAEVVLVNDDEIINI
ncbi:ATP phosphoribosyltransferase regulatory subunit [Eubacterium xylanophilum]|uniref:ATP phosphoribosyltransferase regulatory subunit n=1 Tax=Eubacterium xylanophilum TaxID=39497 RepID=UPI00047AF1D2|nr:ATP phosphoribosyltransferase regulatory subunit [Eubacterium xylanophilum]